MVQFGDVRKSPIRIVEQPDVAAPLIRELICRSVQGKKILVLDIAQLDASARMPLVLKMTEPTGCDEHCRKSDAKVDGTHPADFAAAERCVRTERQLDLRLLAKQRL